MEEKFERYLKFVGLQDYCDNDYFGQGVKIATIENTDNGHGRDVYNTLKTYAPQAEVVSYSDEFGVSAVGDTGDNQTFPKFVDWCIENKVDIVTSSLGWDSDKENEKQAIQKLYNAGIIFVNCIGNENKEKTFDSKLASCTDIGVIGVGAYSLDINNKVSYVYNYGEPVDVLALGKIVPIKDGDVWVEKSGTSFATPIVASFFAVLKSTGLEINSKNAMQIIKLYSKDFAYKDRTYKIFMFPNYYDVINAVKQTQKKEVDEMKSIYKGDFKVSQIQTSTHTGLDLVGLDDKTIYSNVDGKIERVGWENDNNHSQGFGQRVWIKGNDGRYYVFGHLNYINENLKVGDVIKIGDIIGLEGNTGKSTGSHCHFEIRKQISPAIPCNAYEYMNIPNQMCIYKGDFKMEEKPSEWAEEAVKFMVENKITDGTRLKDNITREEVIAMLYRLYNLYQ